jgi:hypothetical protein
MKKVVYVIANIIELALLSGTYIINYFTVKKMGMLRWVVFKNMMWEKEYPITMLIIITAAALVILTVAVLLCFIKRRELKKIVTGMNAWMIVLTCMYLVYIVGCSTEKMRAYYLISLILALAAMLQIVKSFIGILLCKDEK